MTEGTHTQRCKLLSKRLRESCRLALSCRLSKFQVSLQSTVSLRVILSVYLVFEKCQANIKFANGRLAHAKFLIYIRIWKVFRPMTDGLSLILGMRMEERASYRSLHADNVMVSLFFHLFPFLENITTRRPVIRQSLF